MKKSGLIFNEHKVYYFLPGGYWWKQLLINLGIGLIIALILSLF